MKRVTLAAACAAGLAVTSAQAAEITGGYVDIGYSAFTDDTSVSSWKLAGSGELGFSRVFGLQLDLAAYNFGQISETGTTATLHGVFHVSNSASVGLFLGRDSLNSADATFYGIEGGFEIGPQAGLEAYVARDDGQAGSNSTLLGAKVEGAVSDQFNLNAQIDYVDAPAGVNFSRASVGADYNFGEGAKLYGEIGSARASAFGVSGNEPFIALGFRYDLGAARGTTFGRRGLLDKIPGL
ncbi:outer membrane beta-barrel protein [Primorskyibacter sp. S87]|uniref:outer membrane beta-barrel protein n=1 Tax=Primorskyibacter sp. S87 TaxID=3415126 RepID=UPI003C7A288E